MHVLWYLDTIKRWFQDTTKNVEAIQIQKVSTFNSDCKPNKSFRYDNQ